MLTTADKERYERDGFIVVPDVLSTAEVEGLRRATDAIVEKSRSVADHNAIYDLEPGHSAALPRVRRIKQPDKWHADYAAMVRHSGIVACLRQLWSQGVRFDTSKLNMKSAGFGSPVEWHQDWAFYPHTNDDLCAVGVMLDDVDEHNGAMLVVPGSHKGPVFDHHVDGRFCGAIDPTTPGLDVSTARPCLGNAGSITIHHVRAVHGSAPNTSDRQRRFLLLQYRAADAWPLIQGPMDWDAWTANLVAGEETWTPRLAPVPVRLPLPPARNQGSIYENQRELKHRFFEDHPRAQPAST